MSGEIVRPGEGSPNAPSVDATLEWWASVRNEGGPTDGGVISMFGVLADEVERLRGHVAALEMQLSNQGQVMREQAADLCDAEEEAYGYWCAMQEADR